MSVTFAFSNHSTAERMASITSRFGFSIPIKKRTIPTDSPPLSDTLPDPTPAADQTMAEAMRLARLIEAVRSLPENLKAVACLYLEDTPVKHIAVALGISENNASVRLHRAKSAIRLSFGDPS